MDAFMDKIYKYRIIESNDFKLVNNEWFLSCSNKIAKWISLRTEEFGVENFTVAIHKIKRDSNFTIPYVYQEVT